MTVKEIIIAYLDEHGYESVEDIVREWLEDNGFDGLCTQDCGCSKDDLFPCSAEGNQGNCVPGHKGVNEDGQSGIFAPADVPPDERDQT